LSYIVEIFGRYPKGMVQTIARHYPFDKELLSKWAEVLGDYYLKQNPNIFWDDQLIKIVSSVSRYPEPGFWEIERYFDIDPKTYAEQYVDAVIASAKRMKYWDRALENAGQEERIARALELVPVETLKPLFECYHGGISGNTHIVWSHSLIDRYIEQWNWRVLCENPSVPWSYKLVKRYRDRIDWYSLSKNTSADWSEELIALALECADDRAAQIEILSRVEGPIWSYDRIREWKDLVNWTLISANRSIPWGPGLIHMYEDKWDWKELSKNPALQFTVDLIRKYKDKWDWSSDGLSWNEGVVWTESILDEFSDQVQWDRLSQVRSIARNMKLLERYSDEWKWSWLRPSQLSYEQVLRFRNKWDFGDLGRSDGVEWSRKVIAKFSNEWHWSDLIQNQAIPWDAELFTIALNEVMNSEFYTEELMFEWDEEDQMCHSYFELDRFWESYILPNENVWNTVLKPLLNDQEVDKLLSAYMILNK